MDDVKSETSKHVFFKLKNERQKHRMVHQRDILLRAAGKAWLG